MSRNDMLKVALLILSVIPFSFCNASETTNFNVKVGLVSINSEGKPFISEETTRIPYKVGLMFGAIVESSPPVDFECSGSIMDPSDIVAINDGSLEKLLKGTTNVDVTTNKTEAGTIVNIPQSTCYGKLYAILELFDTDKPGVWTMKLNINNKQHSIIKFDVYKVK